MPSRKSSRYLPGALLLGPLALVVLASFAPASPDFPLAVPVECDLPDACAIQQYPDHDETDATADYMCGEQTYDGHTGTDIRLTGLKQMHLGVPVLAAADGTVKAVRNNMLDAFRDESPEDLEERECGNGVVIDHGDGWETQYCHMRQGSVLVRPGMAVSAGTRLGYVGLSGFTDFPHLEFLVRHNGRIIDPFTGTPLARACGGAARPLWANDALSELRYRDALILNTGFAAGPVTMREIDQGAGESFDTDRPPDSSAGALVMYGRAINLKAGDQLRVTLSGPAGTLVDQELPSKANHQAQRMGFAGVRRPEGGWPPGLYVGTVRLMRSGAIIDSEQAVLSLP